MKNEHLIAAKELYDTLYELMGSASIHKIISKAIHNSDIELDGILFLDSLKLMLYVANSDTAISQRELNIINYITGQYLSHNDVQTLIKKHPSLLSFEDVPTTIIILCSIENFIYKNNERLKYSLLERAINFFEIIGLIVADADCGVSNKERARIDAYIETIKEYATEKTLSPFFNLD